MSSRQIMEIALKSGTLKIKFLSLPQIIDAIHISEEFKLENKIIVDEFMMVIGSSKELLETYFRDSEFNHTDSILHQALIKNGYGGILTRTQLCIQYETINPVECAKYGNLRLYQKIRYPIWNDKVMDTAAYHGHLNFIKFLHEKTSKISKEAIYNAVAGNNLECLKYLFSKRGRFSGEIFDICLENKYLECLEFIVQNFSIEFSQYDALFEYWDRNCFAMLYNNNKFDDVLICEYAIEYRKFECVEFLFNNGYYFSDECGVGDDYKILVWLHNKGYCLTLNTAISSVYASDRKCLEYLYNNNCEISVLVAETAIEKDNLDCIQFILEQKLPFPLEPLAIAIIHNAGNCINFFIEQKYFVGKETVNQARMNKRYDILDRVLNQIEKNPEYIEICLMNRDIDGAYFFVKRDFPFNTDSIPKVVLFGDTFSLRFIFSLGIAFDKRKVIQEVEKIMEIHRNNSIMFNVMENARLNICFLTE